MKQLKNPTKKQKILMKENKLNPDNWQIERNLEDELIVIHRKTKGVKHIQKV